MGEEHLLQPGTVIAGRYEVVKCLGAGSMGLVYACRHRELSGHMVAVKVLFPEVAQDKIAAQRFRNEIFAAYGVSHPNVVRAYEYLRDGDLVAYTMEYVGGGDLADRLERAEPMPIHDVISILSQMAAGVQAIHDARIVHRDLKPENILLTKDGVVKIADFGIARVGHGPKLTEHGGVVGTIDYVSPEYMLNSQVDWRSDIYAMGILGYEMVTGHSPFRGDSVYATMTKRLKSDPEAPSKFRSDCPPELERIILKAMARDPEQRYQAAAEMFHELRKLLPDEHVHGTPLLHHEAAALFDAPAVRPEMGIEDSLHGEKRAAPSRGASAGSGFESWTEASGGGDEEIAVMEGFRADPTVQTRPLFRNEPMIEAEFPTESGLADDGTIVVNPEIVEIASQYQLEETVTMPLRMESVLAYSELEKLAKPVRETEEPTQIITNSVSLNDSRIRKLSQIVEKVERSIWVEVVTLVVAVVIGVGVGFFCVRLLVPGLLERPGRVSSSAAAEAAAVDGGGAAKAAPDKAPDAPG